MSNKADELLREYTSPGKKFVLTAPIEWSLEQSPEELQIMSGSGGTAVTISTYKRTDQTIQIDCVRHLKKFLSNEGVERVSIVTERPAEASAEYFGKDNQHWYVSFRENEHTLLLATGNATAHAQEEEFLLARKIINSINLI